MSLCPPLEDLSPAKRAVLARSIRDSGDPGDILIWNDKIIMGEERLQIALRTRHEQRVDQIHRARGHKTRGPRCDGPTHPPLVPGQGSASSCHRLGVRIPMAAHRTPPAIWIGRK